MNDANDGVDETDEEIDDELESLEQQASNTFEVDYVAFDSTVTSDVTFDISPEAEQMLLSKLADSLYENAHDNVFDGQTVHMYKKLCQNNTPSPPWFGDEDEKRTYDLELTQSQYNTLSALLLDAASDVHDPDTAGPNFELVEVWEDVTTQMQSSVDPSDDPVSRVDTITIDDGTVFDVFENQRTGDTWFKCTECEISYSELGDEHECVDLVTEE